MHWKEETAYFSETVPLGHRWRQKADGLIGFQLSKTGHRINTWLGLAQKGESVNAQYSMQHHKLMEQNSQNSLLQKVDERCVHQRY